MVKRSRLSMISFIVFSGVAIAATGNNNVQQPTEPVGTHGRAFWKGIVQNHYAIPPGEKALSLAVQLNEYLGSSDPELRDTLAYSILYTWSVEQKTLSSDELATLLPAWEANLRSGIGEMGTDSVFKRSFSALCLAAVGERDLREPFLGRERFRSLLEDGLTYLREERDLRGFDERKGWIHATAHTADLLATLAANPHFTKQDQRRVLVAIAARLATANTIFSHGEQYRLGSITATIVARDDFDTNQWLTWVADMERNDQAVFSQSPPQLGALQRFENDTYFLQATFVAIALRPSTDATKEASKTVEAILRRRS
jgi:hypothetical protein